MPQKFSVCVQFVFVRGGDGDKCCVCVWLHGWISLQIKNVLFLSYYFFNSRVISVLNNLDKQKAVIAD